MAEIRLTGIDKIYPGGTHAVHSVDLHIADGEFMIMVGPSGCAKSTILRMIAGLETPTGGTIEIGGRVVNDVAPKDRDIAMVFQSYALYPHMTVRENMAFGLRLRKMPPAEIDQRVSDAARILGLEQLLDRLPKAMSGGQRQRVAMGRAIVREPQAFLMDEPLSNLDAKLRVQMRTEIAKLHQRLNTTTVYVTHDQVEAMTLGQRICILRAGVVQQVDTPFQVYQNPANIFVGGFMGSPGMNFMHGQLVTTHGALQLQLGQQLLPIPQSVAARLTTGTDVSGRQVVVGIRPEHLALTAPSDAHALPARIELTEAMGSELYAYFTADVTTPDLTALSDTQATASTFVARLDSGAELRGGEQVLLRPDMDELHLFDPVSMQTLLAPIDEAQVRARQQGATVIQLPTHTAAAAAIQPVITGTLDALADPSRIASVFDAPVAAPIAVEPFESVLAVGASHHGAPSRPSFASTIAPGLGGDSSSIPAPFGGRQRPGTALDLAPPIGTHPQDGEQNADEPAPAVEAAAEPAAPAATPIADPAAEPVAEAPARPRGFAPRRIGTLGSAPTPAAPATPATHSGPAAHSGPATSKLAASNADLDDAIDALDVADAAHASATAAAAAPAAPDASAAPSPFRAALNRIREESTTPPSSLSTPFGSPASFEADRWKISMQPPRDPNAN